MSHTSLKDVVITLKTTPFDERHKIVTGLTGHHGKISVLAKNSVQSRRFGSALELFTASEWHFSEKPGSDLGFLKEALVRKDFLGLRSDFERLTLGSVFCEILLKLAPQHAPCPDLFKLLANSLALLEDIQAPDWDLKTLNIFLLKVLQWSGHQPQLASCLNCQKNILDLIQTGQTRVLAIVTEAGWVCLECRADSVRSSSGLQNTSLKERLEINPVLLLNSIGLLKLPIRKAIEESIGSRQEQIELFRFLEALLVYHIPGFDQGSLKSLKFLSLESMPPMPAGYPQ